MTQTLGALIASGDFTGYQISDASWSLDADAIEDLLYRRQYGSYSLSDAHAQAFFDAETFTAVKINTWICTDTNVGLEILCLNGIPVILSWQTARKCDRQVSWLSKEARDIFAARWEAYRPAFEVGSDFVDPATLAMPVAGPGQKPFDLDTASPVEKLRPSVVGVAQWLEAIAPAGGLDTISIPETLLVCRAGAQADVDMHVRMLSDYAEIAPERRALYADEIDRLEADFRTRIAEVEQQVLSPIDARLSQIEPQ